MDYSIKMLYFMIGICLALMTSFSNAAEILMMPSSIFPVHRYNMRVLAKELLRRNHSVTWFEYGLEEPVVELPDGVNEIFVKVESNNSIMHALHAPSLVVHSIFHRIWLDPRFWFNGQHTSAWVTGIELCDKLLANQETRAIFDKLVERKFDAVVLDDQFNPCGLIHTALQKSIFVYWSMTGLRTESAWANQSPSPPSYVPVPGTGLSDEMDFFQRWWNLVAYVRQLFVHQHIILRRVDALTEKYFPDKKLPEAFYMERNASINFVNHPPIFDFARAYMPRVNFVGGLHCRKANPLPKELDEFVNTSNDEYGFILITGGFTNLWKYAPRIITDSVVKAMVMNKKMRFVWQYNGPTIKNQPENLFIASWVPQQDLLGHPKCRAHVSHGGLNSVIESVWHGVPVIGWPLTAQGRDNLLRVTTRYAGIMLESKQPNELDISSALNRIYIRHYKDEMLVFQDMVIDVPYTELNHSAFWVEFIVRHQEVPHARSGADELNILQYFLVDVIAFVAVVASVIVYLVYLLFRSIYRLVKKCCIGLGKKWKLDEYLAKTKKGIYDHFRDPKFPPSAKSPLIKRCDADEGQHHTTRQSAETSTKPQPSQTKHDQLKSPRQSSEHKKISTSSSIGTVSFDAEAETSAGNSNADETLTSAKQQQGGGKKRGKRQSGRF